MCVVATRTGRRGGVSARVGPGSKAVEFPAADVPQDLARRSVPFAVQKEPPFLLNESANRRDRLEPKNRPKPIFRQTRREIRPEI